MTKFFLSFRHRVRNKLMLSRWVSDAWRMRRFVREAVPATEVFCIDVLRTAVIVTPWFGSAVPWFSMTFGLLLAGKGHSVTFVLDDQRVGQGGYVWCLQLICLRFVLRVVGQRHLVLQLSDFRNSAELDNAIGADIDRLAYLNAVWANKGESSIDQAALQHTADQLIQAQHAIVALLDRYPQNLLFVPGGVCATSGLWLGAGQVRGIRVSTYDSGGNGVLLLAANGIACQLHDIPRAYAELKAKTASEEDRRLVVGFAQEEIAKRRAGIDRFSSQVQCDSPVRSKYQDGVLVALNSPWDSAALGLHSIFETTQDWIIQTVRYLLENSSAPILVRQHPVERFPIAQSVDNTHALLLHHFGEHPRLHFIGAEDPVNSYDLMEQVKGVVVYTSTVGVEAVAYGKPVITESTSYYSGLGFVQNASMVESYFLLLNDLVNDRCKVTPQMRDDALFCYYITQCCNWMQTSFTVQDFPTWSRRCFDELSCDSSVDTVIASVISNTPVSLLNHQHRWAEKG